MPPTGLVHIQTALFSENNPKLGGIIQAAGNQWRSSSTQQNPTCLRALFCFVDALWSILCAAKGISHLEAEVQKLTLFFLHFSDFLEISFRLLCCSSLTFGLRVNKSIIATPAIGIWVGIDWRRAAVALHHLWQLSVGKGKATERNRQMCTLLSLQEPGMCSLIFTAKSLWVLLWWWSWNYLLRILHHVVCPTYQNRQFYKMSNNWRQHYCIY